MSACGRVGLPQQINCNEKPWQMEMIFKHDFACTGLFFSAKWFYRLRRAFQKEDLYHLLKHKRKLRPDLLTEQEHAHVKRPSFLIRLHRVIARPFQKVRRSILRLMYRKNILHYDPTSNRSPENNPGRFFAAKDNN